MTPRKTITDTPMTLHEELAGLLRVAAEKEPEKFQVEQWEVSDRFTTSGDDGWEVRLDRLDDPGAFPCDCMDAIASAVGMRFDCVMNPRTGKYWSSIFIPNPYGTWDLLEETEVCEDKRTASMSALIACINYRMEGK